MVKIQPKTLFVGKNLIFLPSCHSTNDIAAEIIQKKQFIDGTVILTDHQSNGKGQRGNSWESANGQNLLMSIVLKTNFIKATDQFELSILTAVSIFEALSGLGFKNLKIKWPNDIFINEKKIGGILIENNLLGQNLNHSIIGIGLNISQTSFESKRASSLAIEQPDIKANRDLVSERICESLERNFIFYKSHKIDTIKTKYLENLLRKDELAEYKVGQKIFLGKILGIEPDGKLKILEENKEKYYDIKEIEHLFRD